MNFLYKLKEEAIKLKLDVKYNLLFDVSKEDGLLILNKNNNFLLIAILEDPDVFEELRVYTDDEYLIIKKSKIINFLVDYLKNYFNLN